MDFLSNDWERLQTNSWLGLLAASPRPRVTPGDARPNPFRRIYTYDHPDVAKARQLYNQKKYSNSEIARAVGIHAKAITRWLAKGMLTER